jgi:L-fuconolactonase
MLDAHHHLWQRSQPFNYEWLKQPNLARINRDYLPDDLWPQLQQHGINGSIVVQTQHDLHENDWALQLAEQYPWIKGVVGWIDLASPDCEQQLLQYKQQQRFVGVRHVTQDEPDDNFIIRPAILKGLQVLERHAVPFDLLFYAKHLHHAPTVARAVPNLTLVLDHLSKPLIKSGQLAEWSQQLRAAAACPNIVCKLSGLITEADWSHWSAADLRPFVEVALESFGPQRLLYGSDWPVCELAGSYEQVFTVARELTAQLSSSEQKLVFGDNARRVYGITW